MRAEPIVLEWECALCGRRMIGRWRPERRGREVRPTRLPHSFPFDCAVLDMRCDRCPKKRLAERMDAARRAIA